jgi:DNA repair exonuclease SbcCD ATPase subunit
MLNIYQGFYQNIWPLKNKSVLLNYKQGKVMIKAPIWTWKSFLFFDAPIYALYKTSSRTITNKDSKSWMIQLLFSINENYYLVIRKLTQTKTGKDSTKTFLYEIIKNKEFIDYLENQVENRAIFNSWWSDILTNLKFHQVQVQDLTTEFKQEKELQEALNDILPPKEVALSVIFLAQNSDNVFEKTPAERIEIFKKVFGILWIDDAKAIIDEKRKEIATLLKARQETSSYDEKLSTILWKIKSLEEESKEYNTFSKLTKDINNKLYGENLGGIFDEMKLEIDKLTSVEINFQEYLDEIKQKQEHFLQKNEKYKSLQEQIQDLENEKWKIQSKIKQIQDEILLAKDLDKKQESLLLELKAEKLKLEKIQDKQNKIEKKYENIQQEYEDFLTLKNNYFKLKKDNNILENEIKKLKQEKENLIQKIEKLKSSIDKISTDKLKEIEHEKEKFWTYDFEKFTFNWKKVNSVKELEDLLKEIKLEWLSLKEKIEKHQEIIKEVENDLKQLEEKTKLNKKISFHCEKINSNCPFIEKIWKLLLVDDFMLNQIKYKKEKLSKLKQELQELKISRDKLVKYWKENNVNDVLKKIEKYYELDKKYQSLLKQIQQTNEQNQQISKYSGQIQSIEQQLLELKNKQNNITKELESLEKILSEKKQIQQDYDDYKNINQSLSEQLKKISSINEELEKIKDKETYLNKLKTSIQEQEKNLKTILEKIKKLEQEKEKLLEHISNVDLNKLKEEEKLILSMKEQINKLNNLIFEWQENKLSILELKNKLGLYKDLSNIFGREILMYVFQDYIGNLEALINYFIQDIVNFTLHIQLDESGTNLDIFVEDEKWKRQVQSLSGWQKTALRIAWILAINKLQNSKILFLDETINNFDQESIHKIASKIKEFTEENDIKFYMITHSDILQQMNIWDEILELKI